MEMQVAIISPFIESIGDLFSTMLGCEAIRGDVGVVRPEAGPRDIMALIGLSGMARGMVALSFPVDTALNMVNKLLATEYHDVDDTVLDAIVEMVTMVARGARSRLGGEDCPPIDLSLPTLVRGNGCRVDYPSGSIGQEIPFDSALGSFTMRVTVEMETST